MCEQINKMGHTAKPLSSGFISVESPLDETVTNFILEQKGTVVVSGPTVTPAVSKMLGSAGMVDRRKLPPPAKPLKSPPTFTSSKKIKEEIKNNKQTEIKKSSESLKTFALETLKKLVEKQPNRFPKLAKMFGIEIKK